MHVLDEVEDTAATQKQEITPGCRERLEAVGNCAVGGQAGVCASSEEALPGSRMQRGVAQCVN
jgi:hypothetical protein